jgi:UDP-glucose 4-epimerase
VNGAALEGRRVVVTGGLGLIGSRLARAAAAAGASVVVVDALVPEHGGHRRNLDALPNVDVVELDLVEVGALRPLLDGAEIVFNLAGQRSHTDSMREPLTDLHHNGRAQLALLEACRAAAPAAHVLFASTRQVYGRVSRIPADESERLEPRDINGIHKTAAEHYHSLYHALHGLPTTILRLTNTYGPGMRIRDARQGFLGAWVRAVLRGEEFEVWGGSQLRDFNYVDDVVDAFLRAATGAGTVGRTFNLGGGAPLSLEEVARVLVEVAGSGSYRVVPLPPAAAAIDIGDYAGDYSAFNAATGWEPRVGLRDGLERTLAFFRDRADAYL